MLFIILILMLFVYSGKSVFASGYNDYFARNSELSRQKRLEVHYENHHRNAIWLNSESYELKFNMASNVGVSILSLFSTPPKFLLTTETQRTRR